MVKGKLIFQTMDSLKYLKFNIHKMFTPSGYQTKEIKKLEFLASSHFQTSRHWYNRCTWGLSDRWNWS